MKIGYIIASNEVMLGGKMIGYLYREEPDNANDSGWRAFSGEESQEYADESKNFSMYNASSVVEKFPEIAALLANDYPIAFERDADSGEYVEVNDEADDA